MFEIIAANYDGTKKKPLPIGRTGEHETRYVVFDLSDFREKLGEGTWSIVAQRAADTTPYVCPHIGASEEGYAVWILTNVDTAHDGLGYVELRYYPSEDTYDDSTAKTKVWTTFCARSLGVTGETPDPWEDIIEQMAQYVSDASSAATNARTSATSAASSAAEAKEYADNIGDPVSGIVTNWLNEHVDPETGYVIDDTLTIRGAAADAKAVGDLKGQLTDLGLSEVDGVINITYEEVEN